MIALYIHNSLIHGLVMRSTIPRDPYLITVPVKNPLIESFKVRIKTPRVILVRQKQKQNTHTKKQSVWAWKPNPHSEFNFLCNRKNTNQRDFQVMRNCSIIMCSCTLSNVNTICTCYVVKLYGWNDVRLWQQWGFCFHFRTNKTIGVENSFALLGQNWIISVLQLTPTKNTYMVQAYLVI